MAAPDARRVEELTLNSSAPPAQLLYDGWLLRLAPGKAKRARSVNAVYPSTLPLGEKISHVERLYGEAGLPAIFRITPFADPPELDAALAARGYLRFDETAVQGCELPASCARGEALPAIDLAPWTAHVAALRGSPRDQAEGHLARLRGLPLRKHPVALEEGGRVVAAGLAVVEGDAAGLFDIVTHPEARRRGHARRIVTALLRAAWELGARHGYLQVEAGNAPALALYAAWGFRERYRYWYRGRPGETA